MSEQSWLKNRVAVLATMHRKEQAIAPPLKQKLNMEVIVPENFNTDRFGTFTRDIERAGTQLEAARLKAQTALEVTGETLAIASEGMFYPHPALPSVACNREIVLLLDKKHDLEIVGTEVSLETNFAHQQVKTVQAALEFAQKAGFPEHGLVVMFNKETQNQEEIFKGITDPEQLVETVEFVLKHSPQKMAHIETDMRAMYNPTRMQAIAKATENLIEKIEQICPNCGCPGFDVVERKKGLPCQLCKFPTSLIRAEIYQCQKCQFRQESLFPQGQEFADPAQCMYCNP